MAVFFPLRDLREHRHGILGCIDSGPRPRPVSFIDFRYHPVSTRLR